jgi:hypothetical protein
VKTGIKFSPVSIDHLPDITHQERSLQPNHTGERGEEIRRGEGEKRMGRGRDKLVGVVYTHVETKGFCATVLELEVWNTCHFLIGAGGIERNFGHEQGYSWNLALDSFCHTAAGNKA